MTDAKDHGRGGNDASLLALGSALLRRRRTIISMAVLGAAAGLTLALASRRMYSSAATFIPQSSPEGGLASSGLALAASQLGIRMPMGGGTWGPPVYVEVLRSRAILGPIALDTVVVAEDGGRRAALMDLLKVKAPRPDLRRERAIVALRRVVQVGDDKALGAVRLTVRTRWPSVSLYVAEQLVQSVNQFNLASRRSQAAAERQFVEVQAADAERALRDAEDRLRAFLLRNRTITDAPDLVVARDRLQRDVTLRQQVYTTLVQNREEARIREVRDTPVITVIETPQLAVIGDRRRSVLKAALGGIAGTILGVLLVLLTQRISEMRGAPREDAVEFFQLIEAATPRFLRRRGRT